MDGIIILDKESGLFSRTAGYRIAHMFNEKKFGHIGTLDPMATGVLPIAIGNATKIIPFVEDICSNKKEYFFGIKFGIETDSMDITGKVINTGNKIPSEEDILRACNSLIGDIKQRPPLFSAIHVNGARAYNMARNGIDFEVPERQVHIFVLEYLGNRGDEYNFHVICSKGTYVRSITKDIALLCDTVATTSYIRRTFASGFSIKDAIKLDFLENLFNNNGDISKYLMSPDCALGDIPVINLDDKDAILYRNGGFIKVSEDNGLRRVYSDKSFIGIGFVDDNYLRPKRTF